MKKKRKRRQLRTWVKVVLSLLVISLVIKLGVKIVHLFSDKIEVQEQQASITQYYTYGNHFNIKGNIELENMQYESVSLVFYGEDSIEKELKTSQKENTIYFYVSDTINGGFYIDDLAIGEYTLYLKVESSSKDESEVYYYTLKNESEYETTNYYTLSSYNHVITFYSEEETQNMMCQIKENDEEIVYDITIDPGHGGMDGGSVNGEVREADVVLDLALKMKDLLEKEGYRVFLTHDESLTRNEMLSDYGKGGRAVLCNEVHSKYLFSLHMNANEVASVSGFEIYTSGNIEYTLAQDMVKEIQENTSLKTASTILNQVSDGIYTYVYNEEEIDKINRGYQYLGYEAYEIKDNVNHLFMIRETGGFMSGAFIDGRNDALEGTNPYYNTNTGNESYLLELGYITNDQDLKIILESKDALAKAIVNAIVKNIEN